MAFSYIPNMIKQKELYVIFIALCIFCSALMGVLELLGDGTMNTFIWLACVPIILVITVYLFARLIGPLPKGAVRCTPEVTNAQLDVINNFGQAS
jgi:hypothetical protein